MFLSFLLCIQQYLSYIIGCSLSEHTDVADPINGTNNCSEEQLLNITFKMCDTAGSGEVHASTVMQYLQDITAQNPEMDRLLLLHDILDPRRQDIILNRETFHTAMKKWIAVCKEDW
ncbi:KASH5 protein, partial [Polypterus senegalus]|nr:KASH5 protein [Polypterus senegalus]